MYTLYPYFTNDGSVGLFSPEADDIYHSTYGALSEAYEKFIIPSGIKNFIKENPTAIAVGFLYAFEAVLFKYGNCIAYGFFVSFHAILVNF